MLISRPKAKQTPAEARTTARDTRGEQHKGLALQALSVDGCSYGCGRCDLLKGCNIGKAKIGLV